MSKGKTIIAEYCETVLHHETLAAQAEQDRRIHRENYCDNNRIFPEVHQQDLVKTKEFQKFQSFYL